MPPVIIRNAAYDDALAATFAGMLDALGGRDIPRDGRVLVKPNLLSPARPEEAVLTHFSLVRAAVEYVLERGARPLVADSPAIGAFARILKEGGLREALKDLPVECRPFEASVAVDVGPPFGAIEIAREAVEADVILNLPKLKTHNAMLLTLGVKNLFGCVVGYRKPEWHMRTGVDRQMFARLHVQICRRLNPAFTVLDGVLAMEGEGPGKGGTPRPIGVLIGSRSALAVDACVCRMIGLSEGELPSLAAATTAGLWPEDVQLDGDLPAVRDFRLPRPGPLIYGPKRLQGFVRRHLLRRPVCDAERCTLCGECEKICPAGAIRTRDKALVFDYDRCIRCFCCGEVCPHAALRSAETHAGAVLRRIARRML
ncbi:MAG: DUF362 domain-containing protein [Syntrophales bacterium]|nr:DUF362 domain-containing protein [Syntrophales bacterium]MDD4339396.1 DUF362 domain-containing protein [Syntrophales bacterium]HOG06743.1 DUF362 domain-containing protein [Syntrophales bacterium]HOS77362.1 DUF362 domain-containing protein [Syntrophales bacterium]